MNAKPEDHNTVSRETESVSLMTDAMEKAVEAAVREWNAYPGYLTSIRMKCSLTAALPYLAALAPECRAGERLQLEFEGVREFIRNLWRNNEIGTDQHYAIIARLDELEEGASRPRSAEGWPRVLAFVVDFIKTQPEDCMGYASDEAGRWPVRDEWLRDALALLPAAPLVAEPGE